MATQQTPINGTQDPQKTISEIFLLLGVTYDPDTLWQELEIVPFDSFELHEEEA